MFRGRGVGDASKAAGCFSLRSKGGLGEKQNSWSSAFFLEAVKSWRRRGRMGFRTQRNGSPSTGQGAALFPLRLKRKKEGRRGRVR